MIADKSGGSRAIGITVITGGDSGYWQTEGSYWGWESSSSRDRGAIIRKIINVGSNMPKNSNIADIIATLSLSKVVIGRSLVKETSWE